MAAACPPLPDHSPAPSPARCTTRGTVSRRSSAAEFPAPCTHTATPSTGHTWDGEPPCASRLPPACRRTHPPHVLAVVCSVFVLLHPADVSHASQAADFFAAHGVLGPIPSSQLSQVHQFPGNSNQKSLRENPATVFDNPTCHASASSVAPLRVSSSRIQIGPQLHGVALSRRLCCSALGASLSL